ncbi:MAG: cytochrome c3 family protein [Candidatus Brocadiaceae bacterium]|nr:cytochrome c3 family protein [Candidatus Brocadiaceae bacterium]
MEKKPQSILSPSHSCTDRCHVNYSAYRAKYKEINFLHSSHSPDKNMECSACHNDDAVSLKTHGALIIQKTDCDACHHRATDEMDCLKCHREIKDYINGTILGISTEISDWMFNVISCKDCHKLTANGSSFKQVREFCVDCHNYDYGLLYDAWKETLNIGAVRSCGNYKYVLEEDSNSDIKKDTIGLLNDVNRKNLRSLLISYGIHNFRLTQMLLRSFDQKITSKESGEPAGKVPEERMSGSEGLY